MPRALAITLAVLLGVIGIVAARSGPPRPLPADAPLERFSALRARELQAAIATEPRPIGSDADAKARRVLAEALTQAGFRVEEQRSFACGRFAACGFVTNVVGVLEGADPTARAVMLAAHHDSVAASPGASDDGAGAAAVVEAARAIGAGARPRRTVVALLTDGEEEGLLGAEAFAREHPLAKRVGAAINVDARGSSGPSFMFETSAHSAWLVGVYARAVDRPATSSLFGEVYRRMPNDTDFSVFRRFATGMSLASIGAIEHYHTSLDTVANADLGTLQHHGDQALALARALADADPAIDLAAPPSGEAVWFDVVGGVVVRWPAPWTLPLAIAALALVVAQALRMRALRADRALLAWPAAFAAAIGASLLAGLGLRAAGALPTPWVAHPLLAVVCLHSTAIVAGAAAASVVARDRDPGVVWAGAWIACAAAGVATAAVAPGAAWLFVVPALAAGLAGALGPSRIACAPARARATSIEAASALPAIVAAILWLPLAWPLYEALGLVAPPLASLPSSVVVATLAPLVTGAPRRLLLVPGLSAAALAIGAVVAPPFDARVPQRVNVVARQDAGEPDARVFVQASWGALAWGEPPRAMLDALGAPTEREHVLPWIAPSLGARAPRLDLPPPEVAAIEAATSGGKRRVRATLRSRRGAPTIVVEIDDATRRAARVSAHGLASGLRGTVLALRAVPAEGVDVEIACDGEAPVEVVLYDVTRGAPEGSSAARAIAARPSAAVPSQEGDVTVVSTPARL